MKLHNLFTFGKKKKKSTASVRTVNGVWHPNSPKSTFMNQENGTYRSPIISKNVKTTPTASRKDTTPTSQQPNKRRKTSPDTRCDVSSFDNRSNDRCEEQENKKEIDEYEDDNTYVDIIYDEQNLEYRELRIRPSHQTRADTSTTCSSDPGKLRRRLTRIPDMQEIVLNDSEKSLEVHSLGVSNGKSKQSDLNRRRSVTLHENVETFNDTLQDFSDCCEYSCSLSVPQTPRIQNANRLSDSIHDNQQAFLTGLQSIFPNFNYYVDHQSTPYALTTSEPTNPPANHEEEKSLPPVQQSDPQSESLKPLSKQPKQKQSQALSKQKPPATPTKTNPKAEDLTTKRSLKRPPSIITKPHLHSSVVGTPKPSSTKTTPRSTQSLKKTSTSLKTKHTVIPPRTPQAPSPRVAPLVSPMSTSCEDESLLVSTPSSMLSTSPEGRSLSILMSPLNMSVDMSEPAYSETNNLTLPDHLQASNESPITHHQIQQHNNELKQLCTLQSQHIDKLLKRIEKLKQFKHRIQNCEGLGDVLYAKAAEHMCDGWMIPQNSNLSKYGTGTGSSSNTEETSTHSLKRAMCYLKAAAMLNHSQAQFEYAEFLIRYNNSTFNNDQKGPNGNGVLQQQEQDRQQQRSIIDEAVGYLLKAQRNGHTKASIYLHKIQQLTQRQL